MKPGPKPSGNKAMTAAERQARFGATHANRAPRIRYRARRPPQPGTEMARGGGRTHHLTGRLSDMAEWLPQNLEASATAEALRAIAILIYPISKVWSHRAVLVATDAKSACRLPGSSTAERADARSVKTTSAASSVHAAGVGRALRYAEGFAPARRRPQPTVTFLNGRNSDISIWWTQGPKVRLNFSVEGEDSNPRSPAKWRSYRHVSLMHRKAVR